MRLAVLALVIVACGGRSPTLAPPKPLEPPELAARLHLDLTELAAIARRHRGRCDDHLLAELEAHVPRMRRHADEATRIASDPKRGPELKQEMQAYSEQARGLGEAIGGDLAASWLACKPPPPAAGDPEPACPRCERLRALVDQIPVL